jgi:4-amino-4-deoxy-L-arabinose transferase-like glycosyltransferase
LVVLAGGAFVLRLAWVLVYGRVNPPEGSINDTTFYQFTAATLANGAEYTGIEFEPTAGWPPGFPFLVSLLYRVFGERLSLALGMNVVLATATVVLLYLIAERMYGRIGGRIAAGLFAILPGPLYMTGLFLSETTFVFAIVTVLALAIFLPDRAWKPILLGVALGLAALTRGEGFLMLAIPLAMWWGTVDRRLWLRRAAVLVAAMALTVLPWTIRNAIVMDAFIPVSNNASWTLGSAHNPRANGGEASIPPSWSRVIANRNETDGAQELRRLSIDWAIHNPLKEIGLIPRKLLVLNQGSGGSIRGWLNAGPRYQWQLGTSSILVFTVLADAFGYFLLFMTLASLVVLGARGLWRSHPAMRGVLAYLALSTFNLGVVYYGQWRYRIPMEPFMVLVATPLMVRAWESRAALADALARLVPESRLAGD